MTQAAIGIASLLVLLILAAGASCWTVAMLKLLAASRRTPQPLADATAQVLAALGYRPGEPLVGWSPRQPVPWGLVDLAGTLTVYFVAILAIRLLLGQIGSLPDAGVGDDETNLPLRDKTILVWANMAASLGLLVVAGSLVALRTWATWRDFGFALRDLWRDLQLGLAAFVMLAPPVYAMQGVLVYFWKPSKHPLMEMFKESPDVGFFIVLFVAAAVVAPLFEELVFRVLLQGFLEKAFSFTGPAHELVFGSPHYAANGPLAPLPPAAETVSKTPEIVCLSDRPPPDSNPYAPPVMIGEGAAAGAGIHVAEQHELRGASAWLPIVISSLVFALLHYSHGPDWVPLLFLAAGMGYLYQRTHRVVPSLVVHALLNSLSMFGLWLQVFALPGQGLGK